MSSALFKQSTIYSIGNVFRKLSGLAIMPLVKLYLSNDEIGVWILLETLFMFVMVISALGVKSGFARWYYEMKNESDRKALFFTSYTFNLFTSALFVILFGGLLLGFSFEILKYNVSTNLVLVFLFAGLFRLFHEVPFILLKLQQKATIQTGHLSLNITLLVGFTYLFLQFFQLGFIGVYWAQLCANVITFLFLLPYSFKNSRVKFLGSYLKDMMQYGLPLAISGFLTVVLNLSDRLIINQFYNPAEAGNFGYAVKVANLLEMIVITSFITAYTYHYFKTLDQSDNHKEFNQIQRSFLLILSLAGLGITLFAKEIIYVISLGDAYYQQGIYIVPFLVLGLIFSGLRQYVVLPLNKHKQTNTISKVLILSGVLNIVLNFVLVPKYGKDGAAWATLVVQVVAFVAFYKLSNRYEKLEFKITQFVIVIALWGIIVFLSFFLPQGFIIPILLKIVLIVLFCLSLVLFRIVKVSDLLQLKVTLLGLLKRK